jgi:hypothetical protein
MRQALLVLCALSLFGTACSKSESTPTPVDAGSADATNEASPADASVATCDPKAPFGKAVLIDYKSSPNAAPIPLSGVVRFGGRNQADATFDFQQGNATKIFVGARSGNVVSAAVERIASTSVVRETPALSLDGKQLFYVAPSGAKRAIFRTESGNDNFAPTDVLVADPNADVRMPSPASATALYALDGAAVVRIAFDVNDKPGAPVPVAGLPANVNAVAVDESETTLYFGLGDSYANASTHVAHRATTNDPWTDDGEIAIAGLQKIESPTWLSPDGCTIVVRAWATVVDRLAWVATKPPKP